MKRSLLPIAILCVVLIVGTGVAVAADPGTGGQPGESCQSQPSNPGGAATRNSPGAPFNTSGVSGGVYANGPGSTPNGHVTNPTAVSQYDVACFQVSQHHP